ncbi:MAG: amino acid permease [Deltaproteobacteria bacterium]|nr:amino acid permease [Deltaproteobacteria bacterium]
MNEGQRRLGQGAATALVVASMVGTGVFTTSGILLESLGSPWLVLLAWLLGGVVALLGALCYGALAQRIPESGGEYVFLARTLHPGAAFVAGWLSLVVGFSVPLGAVASAFAEYVRPFLPDTASPRVVATVLLLGVSLLHFASVSIGARVQAVVVVAEVVLIVLFASFGLGRLYPDGYHVTPVAGDYAKMGWALVFVSFAYLGWNAAVYIGGEVKEPRRNLPRALLYGTSIVTFLYLGLNALFVFAAPVSQVAGRVNIAHIAATVVGGPWLAMAVSGLVALALALCASAFTMTGPQVAARMAQDGLLPRVFRASPGRPPRAALLAQLLVGLFALWTATFGEILTYVGFTLGISTLATIIGLCRIRIKEGKTLHVPGWPWVPGLFMVFVVSSTSFAVVQKPIEGLVGLLTLGLGVAFFFLHRRRKAAKQAPAAPA